MKQDIVDELLERFTQFAALDEYMLAKNPRPFVEALVDKVNDAGFAMDMQEIDAGRALVLSRSIGNVFRVMLPDPEGYEPSDADDFLVDDPFADDPDEDVELLLVELRSDDLIRKIISAPVKMSAVVDRDNKKDILSFGSGGMDELLVVLRIALAIKGVTRAKICKECGSVFFPRRADREYCYPPRKCKNQYHSKRRK